MTCFRGILVSLFLSVILFLQIHSIAAQTSRGFSCDGGDSTPAFNANLKTILASAPKNINAYGFYNGTAGNGTDQVYATALCRADDGVSLCINCVKEAAHSLTATNCPNKLEAIAWYDECMFRFSNSPILGVMSQFPNYFQENNHDASNVTSFSQAVLTFSGTIIAPASIGSFRKFAARKNSNPTIFGYMQCTPDITSSDCTTCLNFAVDIAAPAYSKVGAKVFTPNCFFRYEIYSFIKNTSN